MKEPAYIRLRVNENGRIEAVAAEGWKVDLQAIAKSDDVMLEVRSAPPVLRIDGRWIEVE